jgi:transcriptional antiterminator RfaH
MNALEIRAPLAGFWCMLRWYLVHTKPAGEHAAKVNLERQSYKVYLPYLAQSFRRNGQWRDRIGPLFPRYLFVRLNEGEQSLGPVRFSAGVSGVVRFGSRYAIVPDEVVRELHAREIPNSGLHRLVTCHTFTPGTPVRVTHGVFDGLQGVFAREDGKDRVVLLLKMLGREVAVRLAPECVADTCAA